MKCILRASELISNRMYPFSFGSRGRDPGPKFLHFHAVFGKNWSNSLLAPPPGLAPPLRNPGSATAITSNGNSSAKARTETPHELHTFATCFSKFVFCPAGTSEFSLLVMRSVNSYLIVASGKNDFRVFFL